VWAEAIKETEVPEAGMRLVATARETIGSHTVSHHTLSPLFLHPLDKRKNFLQKLSGILGPL